MNNINERHDPNGDLLIKDTYDNSAKMSMKEAKEWAVSCWREPGMENKTIDIELATEFAKMLKTRVNEAVDSAEFIKARKTFAKHLKDPGLRQAYIANIAMNQKIKIILIT